MRGGALAVEQAGLGKHEGAGADAGDARAALGHRLDELPTRLLRAAASTPSPPEMISVVIAPAEPNLRASISTPDVLRTGPGFAAITRIGVSLLAYRLAISNTEIGPATSSSWKSGKMSTPIMVQLTPCRKLREICHFGRSISGAKPWRSEAGILFEESRRMMDARIKSGHDDILVNLERFACQHRFRSELSCFQR